MNSDEFVGDIIFLTIGFSGAPGVAIDDKVLGICIV